MKIMVLNDGETFTDIKGCQIVDIEHEDLSDQEIEESLEIMNVDNSEVEGFSIHGGFNDAGNYVVGDPRTDSTKSVIDLTREAQLSVEAIFDVLCSERFRKFYTSKARGSLQSYMDGSPHAPTGERLRRNIKYVFGIS